MVFDGLLSSTVLPGNTVTLVLEFEEARIPVPVPAGTESL